MKAYYIDKFETDKEVTGVYNTYQEYIDAHYETLAEHVGIPKESVPDAIKKAEEMGMTYEEYIVSLWNQQSKS